MKLSLCLIFCCLLSLTAFANDYVLVKKNCHYIVQPMSDSCFTRLKFAQDVELLAIPRILSEKLSDLGVEARVDIVTPCKLDIYASTCSFDNTQTGVQSAIDDFIQLPNEFMNSSAVLINSCGKTLGLLHFTNESGRPFNVESALKRITISSLQ